MAGANDFTGKFISSTYQRVLQISGSGEITDGTGSLVSFLPISSSYALTASYVIGGGSGGPETDPIFTAKSASLLTTESFNLFTASYTTGSFTGSFIGELIGTASWAYSASNSVSSSYATTTAYSLFNPYIVTIGTRVYTDDTFITAGFKGYKHVGYNANIIKTRTIANTSGSIDINVKRSGTTLGTISLSNQSASLDTTLAGWTTQLNTDDLLEFHVSQSSTYITDISIFIDIQARQ